jgi:hypothetical protein
MVQLPASPRITDRFDEMQIEYRVTRDSFLLALVFLFRTLGVDSMPSLLCHIMSSKCSDDDMLHTNKMMLLSSLSYSSNHQTVTCYQEVMSPSCFAGRHPPLASSTGATGTHSEGIRRLDSSEALTFQPNNRPCIDLPAGIAREDGSLN